MATKGKQIDVTLKKIQSFAETSQKGSPLKMLLLNLTLTKYTKFNMK